MYFDKCWGSGPGWWRVPVPASQYVHPEFGFLCPTPRFRRRLRLALACLAVAGIGAGVLAAPGGPKLDAALTPVDQASIGDSIPAPSLTPFVGTQRAVVQGAPAAADKPSCVGDTRSERDCGLVKPRKPRMVRVPTDRPAIAAVPLGRIAPPPASIIDETVPAASAGQLGDSAKSGEAVVAAASSEPHKATATPKKAQKSAHRQTQRRDPYWYGAPSWREVRVDDWAARGYAPRERDYRRGGYGSPSFW
jgi:hypothetical protein